MPIVANGLGSALKPSHEPIILAQKPIDAPNIANNVARHGVGALNVAACRVGTEPAYVDRPRGPKSQLINQLDGQGTLSTGGSGRWPTNLLLTHHPDCSPVGTRRVKGGPAPYTRGSAVGAGLYEGGLDKAAGQRPISYSDADGTEEVDAWECVAGCPILALDMQAGERKSGKYAERTTPANRAETFGGFQMCSGAVNAPNNYGDGSNASRFFPTFAFEADDFAPFLYCAKSSRGERNRGLEGLPKQFTATMNDGIGKREHHPDQPNAWNANHHPTVKPLTLVRWLVRLVTPPGETVLDPFMGSGTTGCAAVAEGRDFIGIEREADYLEISRRRVAHAERERDARPRRLPLFGEVADK